MKKFNNLGAGHLVYRLVRDIKTNISSDVACLIPAEIDNNANFRVADDQGKTSFILVENIPPSLDEEFLELFFESKKKKGGGPVKHVKLDREKHWAVVEFVEPEGIYLLI